jgi:hypothetical protein
MLSAAKTPAKSNPPPPSARNTTPDLFRAARHQQTRALAQEDANAGTQAKQAHASTERHAAGVFRLLLIIIITSSTAVVGFDGYLRACNEKRGFMISESDGRKLELQVNGAVTTCQKFFL